MQLDACLRSIEHLAPYEGPITVVYRATTPEFERGYQLLPPSQRVRLVAESDDFSRDVLTAIDPTREYTVFHTDDDVFFRPAPSMPSVPAGFAAFSLRLGENTTYCYPLAHAQPVPKLTRKGAVIAWDWTQARDDFAYPLSLDGHLFPTGLILRLLSRAHFANPNQLEEELHNRRHLAPRGMLAFEQSCLVSIPVNIVNATHRNRAGGDDRLSPEKLNVRFRAGKRIDIETMDFSGVRAAHQEIPLTFTTGPADPH